VFCIPEGMDLVNVPPLMGAGATMFSALYNFEVSPGQTVAMVGLGRWCRAFGCSVHPEVGM
jgi:D-arabinose 1-dehydrogenase-like Zn-dependent alcohol dehydrogenase